jgi:hypothetical protein
MINVTAFWVLCQLISNLETRQVGPLVMAFLTTRSGGVSSPHAKGRSVDLYALHQATINNCNGMCKEEQQIATRCTTNEHVLKVCAVGVNSRVG